MYLIVIITLVLALTFGAWFIVSTRIESTKSSVQTASTTLDEKIRKSSEHASDVYATKDSLSSFNARLDEVSTNVSNQLNETISYIKDSEAESQAWSASQINATKGYVRDEMANAASVLASSISNVDAEMGYRSARITDELQQTKNKTAK